MWACKKNVAVLKVIQAFEVLDWIQTIPYQIRKNGNYKLERILKESIEQQPRWKGA